MIRRFSASDFFVIAAGISIICIKGAYLKKSTGWTYDHPEEWPELCRNGKEQSPIDLACSSAENTTFPQLEFFFYDEDRHGTIVNNGHTVQFKITKSKSGTVPTVSGGGLPNKYVLDQIHFHWGAEHTFNGFRYPSEIHLVHYASIYDSLEAAVKHRNGVAVFSSLISVSPDNDTYVTAFLNDIVNVEHEVDQPIPTTKPTRISNFIPRDRAGYFRYMGSLTTPNCNEGVIWTVFTTTLQISQAQLNRFGDIWSGPQTRLKINYKNVSDFFGRKVFLRKSGDTSVMLSINPGDQGKGGCSSFGHSSYRLVLITFIFLLSP